jgi:hypothetical protein
MYICADVCVAPGRCYVARTNSLWLINTWSGCMYICADVIYMCRCMYSAWPLLCGKNTRFLTDALTSDTCANVYIYIYIYIYSVYAPQDCQHYTRVPTILWFSAVGALNHGPCGCYITKSWCNVTLWLYTAGKNNDF